MCCSSWRLGHCDLLEYIASILGSKSYLLLGLSMNCSQARCSLRFGLCGVEQ